LMGAKGGDTDWGTMMAYVSTSSGGGARFVVVRDNVVRKEGESRRGAATASDEGTELLRRLTALAAMEGYQSWGVASYSSTPLRYLNVTEIDAVNASGDQRRFGVKGIRTAGEAFWAYWQYRPGESLLETHIADMITAWIADRTGDLAGASGKQDVSFGEAGSARRASGPPPVDEARLARTGKLVSDAHADLLIVEGDRGVGSGFVCQWEGRAWAVTNIHVLVDNNGGRLMDLDRKMVETGDGALAVEHDICRFPLPGPARGFEISTNVAADARVGDWVVVPGNSEGAGVIKPLNGRIVGIGPNLIEVDAPFVSGNSGSPIIHEESGKVIGIATYVRIEGRDGEVTPNSRRFGYRLDTVRTWEPMNWARFKAQAAQVRAIQKLSAELAKLAIMDRVNHSDFTDPQIRRALQDFEERVGRTGISERDLMTARRSVLSRLRSVAQSDIAAFKPEGVYDYFKRTVAEDEKFRNALSSGLSEAIENAR
jgi:hypothetical protein